MLKLGQPLNVVMLIDNFGSILTAYYAKKMGLSIRKLICASSSNNVPMEFLSTGVYGRNCKFYTTTSPSIDILMSSNLERPLFDLTGGNSKWVPSWMRELGTTGRYEVGAEPTAILKDSFFSNFCDDAQARRTIHEVFQSKSYLCDPYTAMAEVVCEQYMKVTGDEKASAVIASAASLYKLVGSILEAVVPDEKQEVGDFVKTGQLSSLIGTTALASIT